ncbi:MarR family winged helix-turn-helix transcriptional regulator [Dactylosporangium sp. CA-092794]|uniref:MarR family winged helix-turn-helix transcriptional regulator n=1 Tax=Dactylosporangium sp. CA-092794 TaxID=3239929 RepID=UPI003D931FF1
MSDEMLEDPRITAMGLFVEAFTGVNARLNVQLAEHGLGNVDFEVLMRLARSPGGELRMTDLAAQTGLSTSGVTRVVDRLERDGLATRRACPTDRRGSFTVISSAGRAKMREVLPGHLALIEQWFTGRLAGSELELLLGSLRRIRDAVRPDATSGVPSMRSAA